MDSYPPVTFAWISSPLDEYLVVMQGCEAEVAKGQLKVVTFLAVGEQVDPFRVRPPSTSLPSSSWAATAWLSARAFLFSARLLEAAPLVRLLEPGQLSRRFANVFYLRICYPNFLKIFMLFD